MNTARQRRLPAWVRRPPLTIRTRLTLTYTALFTVGGAALLVGLTTAFYRAVYRPLPSDAIPSRLDPDHDHFIGLRDQIRDAAVSPPVARLPAPAPRGGRRLRIAGLVDRRPTAASAHRCHRRSSQGDQQHPPRTAQSPRPPGRTQQLGDTFDEMLERLDATFAAQRRFVANASHELRTPLAVTRAAVEVTIAKPAPTTAQWRAMAQDVLHSTHRAQRLIDALLVLARSEQRATDIEDEYR